MAAKKFVQSVWESFRANSGLEPRLIDTVSDPDPEYMATDTPCPETYSSFNKMQLKITAASPGRVSFELPIEKHHTNRLGIIHGGTIASMVDLSGSLAVASRGLFSTGVSTDLNVTYLNAGGKIGDTITGEAVCDKFGKTLAYTSVKFVNKEGEIVARGSHTKFVALAHKDPKNMTDELKPEVPESKVFKGHVFKD